MTRGKNNREKRKPKRSEDPSRRWADHERYGRLPLVHHSEVVHGKTYEWWEYDPAFKPSVPRGAVEGDVAQQVYCRGCHVPKYFYVDETRRCIQCDARFVFTAREQKYWYETRKFNFHSVPVRCPACRRQRRSEHALREQVAAARRAVASAPDDPGAQLALACALVELHERTSTGRMEDAVAAARKAARLWPNAPGLAELEARARARLPHARAR